MSNFKVEKITKGLLWVEVAEADLRLCCGCPPDTIKFLNKRMLLGKSPGEKSGPNAILINDARVQKGRMTSFAEFPAMQMLYMQGMIANAGKNSDLPLIVGLKENVKVQMKYLCRGNYGFYTKAELMEAGCSAGEANMYYSIKHWFANGRIYRPKELCKALYLDEKIHELKNGVFIQRIGFNLFQIRYKNEKVDIDLNDSDSLRRLPFRVRDCEFEYADFSVLHCGEGNGWEPENPCMGSLIINNGKIYAVDTGPGFLDIVNHLGLDVQDLEGVFLTHIHDDHFAGLPDMLKSCKKLKLFAAPLIRYSIQKKFSTLMDLEEMAFYRFFDVVDLNFDVWNEVDGMEVMPFFSPHPVETNAFLFRKKEGSEYKTYAHLADTISFRNLEVIKDCAADAFKNLKQKLTAYADVKKVDVGGGFIHGEKDDYAHDPSAKLVLAHHKKPSYRLNGKEYEGDQFGRQDVLVEGETNNLKKAIFCEALIENFPDLTADECRNLFETGEPVRHYRHQIFSADQEWLFVVLNGNIHRSERLFDRGHIEGIANFDELPANFSVSSSFVDMIKLSRKEFMNIIGEKRSWKILKQNEKLVKGLAQSALFHGLFNSKLIFHLARQARYFTLGKEDSLTAQDMNDLFVLLGGECYYTSSNRKLKFRPGDYFGGNQLFTNSYKEYIIDFVCPSELIRIPAAAIENIPLILWKIYENCTTLNHLCRVKN